MNWQNLQRRTWTRWLAAFCFWSVIVLFYSTSNGRTGQETTWTQSFLLAATQWYVWALLAPFLIRFDRGLPIAPDAVGRRILLHVPACFVFTTIYVFVSAWARDVLGVAREPFSWSMAPLTMAWRGMFHWNVLVYWVIFGGYAAYDYYRSLREGELRAVELERLLAESRLEALRAQLHPHFLFNALNAIRRMWSGSHESPGACWNRWGNCCA